MEIRRNTWHAKFYKMSYDGLDQSLCTYFWKLVLALVLLPITFIWYLMPYTRKDSDIRVGGYLIFSGVLGFLIIIGHMIAEEFLGGITTWTVLAGSFIAVVVLAAAIGFIILFLYLLNQAEEVTLVSERRKAWKNKYCPRIEWK